MQRWVLPPTSQETPLHPPLWANGWHDPHPTAEGGADFQRGGLKSLASRQPFPAAKGVTAMAARKWSLEGSDPFA